MTILSENYDPVSDMYLDVRRRVESTFELGYISIPYIVTTPSGYTKEESYDCRASSMFEWHGVDIDKVTGSVMKHFAETCNLYSRILKQFPITIKIIGGKTHQIQKAPDWGTNLSKTSEL